MSDRDTTVSGADFNLAARFIAESAAHARALAAGQRHEAARRVVLGLRCLARTIREAQAQHGFCADLVLASELALIDGMEVEHG